METEVPVAVIEEQKVIGEPVLTEPNIENVTNPLEKHGDAELSWEKIAAEIVEEEMGSAENEMIVSIDESAVVPVESAALISEETPQSGELKEVEEPLAEVVKTEEVPGDAEVIAQAVIDQEITAEPVQEVTAEVVQDSGETETTPSEAVAEDVPPANVEFYEQDKQETLDISTESKSEPNESLEEIQYTVVETDEVETNEIIEEHMAQSNSETVVIINPDQTQTEIRIEHVDDDTEDDSSQSYGEEIFLIDKSSEAVDDPATSTKQKPKKPRGRKPISDIPLHVLGRDITKPSEGVSNGGRTMPKPRLGVKVPYRNLTSQIVSKQEIENEIMERFRIKQEEKIQSSGDMMFARKLTQRLAKKLVPTDKVKDEAEAAKPEIKNNSDLIAILEGEGDEIRTSASIEKKEIRKKTEKEIALQQLRELPNTPTKNKFFKSREEEKVKKDAGKKEEAIKKKDESGKKDDVKKLVEELNKDEKMEVSEKKVEPVKKKDEASTSKGQVESKHDVEPRLKPNAALKTYTRKRRSIEQDMPTPPPAKKVAATPSTSNKSVDEGQVYVTKSSRIIKKKVIWDPDDDTPTKTKSPTRIEAKEKKAPVEKKVEKKIETPKPKPKPEPKESKENKEKETVKTSPLKRPKRLTEVDKLLMDEGAVNMLYDVQNNEELNQKKKNKGTINLDKAHKELMSRASLIKNDLQQHTGKEASVNLRKKETATPPKLKKDLPALERKKSKDSARSSSPPYEASRIIRRHSSSSFTSGDGSDDESKKSKSEPPKKKSRKTSDVKPPVKNNNNVAEGKENHVNESSLFTLNKKGNVASITLHSQNEKCFLSNSLLKQLTAILKELGEDEDCRVVSITSDSKQTFCNGLNYLDLVIEDEGLRKKKATELAGLVKEFLRCLLHFPKILVAGIQGLVVGLGVTMLPLFDMVYASDTSKYSTPYTEIGCVPEAGFLLSPPYFYNHGLASELLYGSQIIEADDAFRRGLITKLFWPEKYEEELKKVLNSLANKSVESIEATKQQLREHIYETLEPAINSINKVLVENWTSAECQKNFAVEES